MRQEERGVALVMVILVLLILTVLGMTAVMMMTQEDKISSRQELQKAALYAAETGLRRGEQVLQPLTFSSDTLTRFISHTAVARTAAEPPSAGGDPLIPTAPPATLPPQWDLAHLGTYLTTTPGGVVELANQEVTQVVGAGQNFDRVRAYFSLYVRNNPDDLAPGGALSPLVNYDTKLRLIAVGFLTDANGVDPATGNARVLSAKIIEEELNWGGAPSGGDWQKCKNPGGTCSGFWSGRMS
ncbi:MAG TPA: PilX N-terminal domain-containing pilus assembly protein [Thermoanaerobaculaceae bacterium]|nr:PilX N-terminal domain-containing pilus assembly protein [Thermoanaerobaculaceae bacterium]